MAGDESFLRRFGRTKEELLLEHEFPHLFYTSQCRMAVWSYVTFRVVLVALTVHSLVLALVFYGDQKFHIYFTHWSYVAQTVTMIYKLAVVAFLIGLNRYQTEAYSSDDDDHRRMPVYLKVKWILHNITTIVPVIVTIVYWTMLFPEETPQPTAMRVYINLEMHGLNSVAAVLDFFVSAVPFRLYHFLHPACFGIIFVAFSVIYGLCGGTGLNGRDYIYFFLDWRGRPLLGVAACIGILVFLTVVHLLFAYFKHLQSFGHCGACCSRANQDARQTQTQTQRLGQTHPYVPSIPERLVVSSTGVWDKVGYVNEAST